MIYLVGDLHIRKEEPFFSAIDGIFKELYDKCKAGDTIIQLGDFFHTYKPFPKEYTKALKWLNKFDAMGVNIIIMAGNNAHEYHHLQKTYAINPLKSVKSVEIITKLSFIKIEGLIFFVIPWIPEEIIRKANCEAIEDYIQKFINKNSKIKADFLLYHYEDETVFMGGVNHGIDFTFIEDQMPGIKRIGGHIHLQSKNYIGSPYQTRYDEKGQISRFFSIDKTSLVKEFKFKQYIKYLDLNYKDNLPELDFPEQKLILTIEEAPSIDSAQNKFNTDNIFIRDVQLEFSEDRQILAAQDLDVKVSIKELLHEYLKINKVDKKTSKYLLDFF